jgi:hypothetical protein
VVDPTFGLEFLKQICSCYDLKGEEGVEMTLEKLQLLATFLVDPTQKSKWLKWWNSK